MGIRMCCQMVMALCLGVAGLSWCAEYRGVHLPFMHQKESLWFERALVADGQLYTAALFWGGMRLRVYRDGNRGRECIMEYEVKEYSPATSREDLIVVDSLQLGRYGFAWRYCEGGWCPFRNGAIFFDVLEKALFELAYEEEKGIILSSNLAEERNRKVRDWLIDWWKEWPANHPDMTKILISYAPRPPD